MVYSYQKKKSGNRWIGWLVDLPGVNAQEKTREELIRSLEIGAEEMLSLEIPFEPDAIMTIINVPEQTYMSGIRE